jgi:hypothetical protein
MRVGFWNSGPDAKSLRGIDECDARHDSPLRRKEAGRNQQLPRNEQRNFFPIPFIFLAEHFDELWFLPNHFFNQRSRQ